MFGFLVDPLFWVVVGIILLCLGYLRISGRDS